MLKQETNMNTTQPELLTRPYALLSLHPCCRTLAVATAAEAEHGADRTLPPPHPRPPPPCRRRRNRESGVVVLLHSWRHQMLLFPTAGYRAVAPDFPRYSLSQPPPPPSAASWSDLVADLLVLLDNFAISKVFLVGEDFGAKWAYEFAIQYPDRVSGIVILGVPFVPAQFDAGVLPDGFYVSRWREPGRAVADFGRFAVKTVVRKVYVLFAGSEVPIAREDQEIMNLADPSAPLPPWFSKEDLSSLCGLV